MSRHEFTSSDGLRHVYHIDDFTDPWKKADTVVMLHAAMGSARRWYAMVPALSRHYRVVRPDLRGHGETQVPPENEPLSLDRLVHDVVELLDALKLERVHVIGNSAGGYVGQQLAMNRPGRVKTLQLFGSTPGLKNSQAASWIPQVAKKGLRPYFKETISDRFPASGIDPQLVEWFLDEIAKNDVPFIAKWVLHMASHDWSDELHRIQCPTLVVVPGDEPIGSTSNYEPFRKLVKDVEMKVYEHARHNICDYLPDRCAADALDFLRRKGAAG